MGNQYQVTLTVRGERTILLTTHREDFARARYVLALNTEKRGELCLSRINAVATGDPLRDHVGLRWAMLPA